MNLSNFIHVACALAVQTAIGLLTDNWWAGAAAGAFMFVGREYTQAAYRMTAAGCPWRVSRPAAASLVEYG